MKKRQGSDAHRPEKTLPVRGDVAQGGHRQPSRFRLARGLLCGAGLFALLPGGTALAQEVEQAKADEGGFGMIIVTARRTEEDLQTTPVAVTALNVAMLETRQITDVSSLQYNAPNVVVQPLLANTGVGISIRGQAGIENTSASDPAVGIYVDGVYTARSSMGFLDLVDVQRVEVLRGPQGTLFGRNTTGGALNITTPRPTGDFSGRLTGRYGNYNAWDVSGHANVPLQGDSLALRVSFKHGEHDGYGQSVVTRRELADQNSDYVRGVLLVAPEEANWSLLLSGDYFNRKTLGPIQAITEIRPGSPADVAFGFGNFISDNFYDSFTASPTSDDTTAKGVSLTGEIELGDITLKSISSYRMTENFIVGDLDGSPLPLIEFTQNNKQNHQITHELQAFGSTGPVKWIAGGFFITEKNEDLTISTTAITAGRFKNTAYALFGQAEVSLTDALKASVGLRYSWDKRSAVQDITNADGTTCIMPITDAPATCVLSRSANFDYLSYNFGLNYQLTDDIFVYANTSRATRSGGFNSRVITPAFNPETVTNYELGLKATLLNGHMRMNIAAFYTDYENVQRTTVRLNPITNLPVGSTTNAAKAHIPGLEAEVSILPLKNLEIGGSLGILDPTYDEFSDNSGDRTGEPFTYTSTLTYNLYATAHIPTSIGEVTLHADYAYKSEIFYDTANIALNRQPGYGLLNVRAGLKLDSPDIEFALYAKNLTQKHYNTYIFDVYNTFGYNMAFRGTPRTWGGEVTFRF